MPTIKVNNAEFYYELHGSGQPIILISGYTCDHLNFATLLDSLSQHFQALILANRGVGMTKDTHPHLTVEVMADDVMTIAHELGLKKPHIVGHSMGGTIAQAVATQFPSEISKLVLLATSAKWREAMLQGLESLLAMRRKNIDFDTIFAATLPWIFDQTFLSDKAKIQWLKDSLLNHPAPQSFANQERQYQALRKWDGRAKLKDIKAPTLVGYGIQDLISLPYESEYLAKNIAHAKLVKFDCAHDFSLAIPKELAKTIMEFCG